MCQTNMASSYSMDIELFISEVKKYPEIWNFNNEDSRYPAKRQCAWTEIAKIFIEDFDDLNTLEKNDVFKRLQSKWRNLRDSFVRHKRRNYGNSKRSYIYAKQLSFLEDQYAKIGSQSGSDADAIQNDGEDTWQSDGDDEAKLKKMLFKAGVEEKDESIIEWQAIEEAPRERKRKKKSSKRERDTQIDFVETNFPEAACSYSNEDEDRSFFNSLIPAIKDFDIDLKLEFRTDVIKLIKSYRKSRSSSDYTQEQP